MASCREDYGSRRTEGNWQVDCHLLSWRRTTSSSMEETLISLIPSVAATISQRKACISSALVCPAVRRVPATTVTSGHTLTGLEPVAPPLAQHTMHKYCSHAMF